VKTTLARVQAATGLAFFAFAAVHFANTMLAAVSREAYDAYQAHARAIYQNPLVEIALFATLFIHIGAGVLSARARRGTPPAGGLDRWHRYTGRALAIVILGHVAATRGPSLLAGVHPGFLGIAYTIGKWPVISYPYFAALIACGILHAGIGAWKALRSVPVPRVVAAALVTTIAACWLGILGLGGRLYSIDDPGHSRFAVLLEGLLSHSQK